MLPFIAMGVICGAMIGYGHYDFWKGRGPEREVIGLSVVIGVVVTLVVCFFSAIAYNH